MPTTLTFINDLVGAGLPHKGGRTSPKTRSTTPGGRTYDSKHDREDEKFLVPGGTLPNGPSQVTRTFKALFAKENREEDYRLVWAFFGAKGQNDGI